MSVDTRGGSIVNTQAKNKPQQFQLMDVPETPKPTTESAKAIALKAANGDRAQAIAFLERDIQRWEDDWAAAMGKAKRERLKHPKEAHLIKDPVRPRSIKQLRAAIQELTFA